MQDVGVLILAGGRGGGKEQIVVWGVGYGGENFGTTSCE